MTTIKLRRDTAAEWATKNPILNEGEPAFATDTKVLKIGDGTHHYNDLPSFVNSDDNAYTQLLDNTYAGVDLTVKFASEIANYSNAWAWIQARIRAGNFKGLHIRDYIPFVLRAGTISDGTTSYNVPQKTMKARIAGIDTYYQYGYPSGCGHHIDFITTSDTIGVNIPWQTCNNNNGSSANHCQWLASKLYACLNGVDNTGTSGYGNNAMGFNASSGGILQLMPQELQNVIVQKVFYADNRWSTAGILSNSTAGDWYNWGKIWVPTEVEVYGFPCNTGGQNDNLGINRSTCGSIQYPIFNCNNRKLDMGRVYVWLSSVPSGCSSRACSVNGNGNAFTAECVHTLISAWVGFRIS